MPTRVEKDIYDAAQRSGQVNSRSAAEQITYWARIGRELEAAPNVSHRDIQMVLAGDGSYDALRDREQALVRATWDERIAEGIAALDLVSEFRGTGESWTEADADGHAVTRS